MAIWAVEATKPYEFIGFGAMDVTKPYEFKRFGAMDVTKTYKFIAPRCFWVQWHVLALSGPLLLRVYKPGTGRAIRPHAGL